MNHVTYYESPVGTLTLTATENGLTGLIMKNTEHDKLISGTIVPQGVHPILKQACIWLDRYFAGKEPSLSSLPLELQGTPFQMAVWDILKTIPYGKTMTYGQIAKLIAQERGISRMSAQAVGNAVGRNPIWIIIPCHRVIGANGSLTGYAGGLERKKYLLNLESNKL